MLCVSLCFVMCSFVCDVMCVYGLFVCLLLLVCLFVSLGFLYVSLFCCFGLLPPVCLFRCVVCRLFNVFLLPLPFFVLVIVVCEYMC